MVNKRQNKMRNDLILISAILLLTGIAFFVMTVMPKGNRLIAEIYYQDRLLLTINLSEIETETTYRFIHDPSKDYSNHPVIIEAISENAYHVYFIGAILDDILVQVRPNAIRVAEEESPRNICSRQSWSSSTYEPIICLPNTFYIILVSDDYDDSNDGPDVVIGLPYDRT